MKDYKLCQHCGISGGKPAVKTEKNLRQTRRVLCAKCREQLGYSTPMYPASWQVHNKTL